MIVYRIEGGIQGWGPYSNGAGGPTPSPWGHPIIADELDGYYALECLMNQAGESRMSEWRWGFSSIPQLRKWFFNPEDLRRYADCAHSVAVYEVAKEFVIEAPLQLMFIYRRAERVRAFDPRETIRVDPEGEIDAPIETGAFAAEQSYRTRVAGDFRRTGGDVYDLPRAFEEERRRTIDYYRASPPPSGW